MDSSRSGKKQGKKTMKRSREVLKRKVLQFCIVSLLLFSLVVVGVTAQAINPNVTQVRPLANNFTAVNSVINISANVTDDVGVSVVLANITYPNNSTKEQLRLVNISNANPSIFNFSFGNTSTEGYYNVTFIANDTSNNINDTVKTNFTVDSTGPTLININPIADSNSTSSVFNISANVTDQWLNVDTVLANVTFPDNTTKEQLRLVSVGKMYNFTFGNATQQGTYNITFIANDTAGNLNTTQKTNITIDSIAPSVTTIRPVINNFTATSSVVNISATVTDFTGVEIVLANVTFPNNSTKEQLRLIKLGNIYNFSFGNTSVEGPYNITFIANDTGGNINSTEKTNFTVDSTGPAVTNPLPNGTAANPNGTVINIVVTVIDLFLAVDTVLANITYPDNATKEQVRLAINTLTTYNFSFGNTTMHGVYSITFTANDTAGNLNTTVKMNFTIDDASPTVSQLSPTTSGGGVGTNYTAIATDNIAVLNCNLFAGTSSTNTTDYGRMDFSSTTNVTSKGFAIGASGTFYLYANCTDTSGNRGFNVTTVTITPASGRSTSPTPGPTGEIGAPSGISAPAPASESEIEEETATATEESGNEEETEEETATATEESGNEEETIKNLINGELLAGEHGLQIKKIKANDELIYENGEQQNTITVKDYDRLDIVVTLKNVNEEIVKDIEASVTNLPEGVEVESIEPSSIESLEAQEEKEVTIHLVTRDVAETFVMELKFIGDSAYVILGVSTVLEAGKGNYYTRERIIEETQEVLIRTYKFLFLLFLIPILLLLRMTTLTDESAARSLIEQKRLGEFWRVYVSEAVYPKYNMFENVKPITQEEYDVIKATELAQKEKISYELASLIIFANRKIIPRIFTQQEISKELRHKYPRILFTSPLRNFREDQLQRYVEAQQAKGYANNEIRNILLNAGWKSEIIKKYIDPEKDLDTDIKEQKQKGKQFGEIRKILLDAKWDKQIIEKHIPNEIVLKEYIDLQRQKGISNGELRKQLLAVRWQKELVQKYLNPEKDLKAYIAAQQQKGVSLEGLKKKLVQRGWKKEIVEKYLKK